MKTTPYYHPDTSEEMRKILDMIRERKLRVRVHFGDTKTGKDWMDVHDVEGTIGLSMGPQKIPLLINNARSMGGTSLLTHCIVRIRYADRSKGGDIYRHPKYHLNLAALDGWPDKEAILKRHFS